MEPFTCKRAHLLDVLPPEQRWLIDDLWSHQAVGIIGGEPKSYKSFLALSMAVAVSSGRPCLNTFHVAEPGPVLLFAAEDALHIVRQRLEGICAYHQLDLARLPLWVITAPLIRLDQKNDRCRLEKTVGQLKPRLLILDPLVRLHNVDENVASAIAPMLAFLRELQRHHGCAVAVVHHSRKGGHALRAGQALRGSSEIHAWGDSNLYLRRQKKAIHLSIEHRAHPSQDGVPLELCAHDTTIALVAALSTVPPPHTRIEKQNEPSQTDRVLHALKSFHHPVRMRCLRESCRIRSESLSRILSELVEKGEVLRSDQGWSLARLSSQQ